MTTMTTPGLTRCMKLASPDAVFALGLGAQRLGLGRARFHS